MYRDSHIFARIKNQGNIDLRGRTNYKTHKVEIIGNNTGKHLIFVNNYIDF